MEWLDKLLGRGKPTTGSDGGAAAADTVNLADEADDARHRATETAEEARDHATETADAAKHQAIETAEEATGDIES